MNGALRLCWGDIHPVPVRFSEFARINGGGRHSVYANIIEEDPFYRNSAIDRDLSGWNNPKTRCPSHLLNLSKADSDLRALLFLVGLVSKNSPLECILAWGTLYKILDTVRYHSKPLQLSLEEFSDINKINAFTAACNNMSILGVYARHGAAGNSPPKRVITDLDEAIDLIISMAAKFCQAYVNVKYL